MNQAAVAMLAVLAALVIWHHARKKGCTTCHEGFGGHQQFPVGKHNPHVVMRKQLDLMRGYRHTDAARGQRPLFHHPTGIDRYHRSGAHVSPARIAEAEREAWFHEASRPVESETSADAFVDHTSERFHGQGRDHDHDSYTADMVLDPRTRENHSRWVQEMAPWSGVSWSPDTLDTETTLSFHGLRRPQPITVKGDGWQLTEVGPEDLLGNARFNFRA